MHKKKKKKKTFISIRSNEKLAEVLFHLLNIPEFMIELYSYIPRLSASMFVFCILLVKGN